MSLPSNAYQWAWQPDASLLVICNGPVPDPLPVYTDGIVRHYVRRDFDTHKFVMREVTEKLMKWDTKKLYTAFSRDGGKTFSMSLVSSFVYDFICVTHGKDTWSEDEWESNKERWAQLMRNIKQKAIESEMRILGYVLGER